MASQTSVVNKDLKTSKEMISYVMTVTSKLLTYFFSDFQLTSTLSSTTIKLQRKYRIASKKLMEGTEMTKQERESMLYDEFDKFTFEPGESIHSYYLRFAKLINDMNMISMNMTPMQINTKFVNHLQPEWSSYNSKRPSYGSKRQGRQSQGYAGNVENNQALGARVINAVGNTRANQPRVIKCYNYKGECHMANQCTARKRVKDSEWFREKMLLAQAQEAGVVLDEEQHDFLADSLEETDDYCDDEATTNVIVMANLSLVGSLNDDTIAPRYDSDTLSEIVDIVLWYLDSGCSKHMTGHRDKLINFVSKFIRTVRFGNDHFAAIMGYEDLQMGNILISRVYYVEGLDHNLFSVGGYKDHAYLIQISTIIWAEAVATACYTQNRSLIHTRYDKTPYELLRDRKPELKYLHVFSALCYPTNNFKDIGKLLPKADIGIFIGYSPSKKAYRIYNKRTRQIMETMNVKFDELTHMDSEQLGSGPDLQGLTSGKISSGIVLNQATSTSAKPPTKNE
ncbi:retrovirus-related pol polyprotein from transposon TNT 1-94 [Tanacetum coccineum]|uniref:Retrovirus-related pol polyprotein from transposon TNT 1-94 n=1 Tax=Tanacetum coccineum TaxID=301880 RepID=A0ABQ4YBF0_9ASTR